MPGGQHLFKDCFLNSRQLFLSLPFSLSPSSRPPFLLSFLPVDLPSSDLPFFLLNGKSFLLSFSCNIQAARASLESPSPSREQRFLFQIESVP